MFNVHFNHNQIRRFLIAFGSFFDNIQLRREDTTGKEIQRMIVPLEYGPKEKWFVRLKQDPDFLQGVGIIVPRMSYELTSISYDGSRHLNSLNPLRFTTTEQKRMARIYVGVPYTMTLELAILSKTQQDGLQIVEQIVPYFTPDLTFKLQTIPELNLIDQVPMTLVSLSEADNYEGNFQDRRAIIWTLAFTMKVNLYGPVKSQSRIEEVVVDIYDSPLNDIIDPPLTITGEDLEEFELENGSGHIMDEHTPESYLSTGRLARIDAVATDPNQDPADPVQSKTTVTEYAGDVKRSRTFTDEKL